jgi:hypothetical protein
MMQESFHLPQAVMSASYTLIVADQVRPPTGGGTASPGAPPAFEYEPGHSERQVTGSVEVGPDSRWLATLAVPMTGDQSALLTLEREGMVPAGAPAVSEVALVIPVGEADAVITLLRGIFVQAQRDGVLVKRKRKSG